MASQCVSGRAAFAQSSSYCHIRVSIATCCYSAISETGVMHLLVQDLILVSDKRSIGLFPTARIGGAAPTAHAVDPCRLGAAFSGIRRCLLSHAHVTVRTGCLSGDGSGSTTTDAVAQRSDGIESTSMNSQRQCLLVHALMPQISAVKRLRRRRWTLIMVRQFRPPNILDAGLSLVPSLLIRRAMAVPKTRSRSAARLPTLSVFTSQPTLRTTFLQSQRLFFLQATTLKDSLASPAHGNALVL